MRYYYKGRTLRQSGITNWQDEVLSMLNDDLDNKAVEWSAKVMNDHGMNEAEKVEFWTKQTGMSRRSYFRYKAVLADNRNQNR